MSKDKKTCSGIPRQLIKTPQKCLKTRTTKLLKLNIFYEKIIIKSSQWKCGTKRFILYSKIAKGTEPKPRKGLRTKTHGKFWRERELEMDKYTTRARVRLDFSQVFCKL